MNTPVKFLSVIPWAISVTHHSYIWSSWRWTLYIELFLNFHPFSLYSYAFSSSGIHQTFISVSCFAPEGLPEEWSSFRLRVDYVKFMKLTDDFSNFTWNNYCFEGWDSSKCTKCVTKLNLCRMEMYISFSFCLTKTQTLN